MSSSLIGRTLGNYKVIDKLGQGGMATVYTGYQAAVDRHVAIKVLPPHPGLDEQFAERFRLEARTIARLQHPHILPLYDYGTDDDIVYLVMAYIDGGSLEEVIEKGPSSLQQIEKLLNEVAGALDYAHRQGVIHRDIKPGNILIDGEGHALLADFGIVKLSEGGANLTGSGVIGTPAYMAPEQAQGDAVDKRIDIYAMGVVVYQMLTGKQPFAAESTMQLMLKVIQEDPPNVLDVVEDLPEGLGEVMCKVLAKDPNERYQTTVEFAWAFSNAIRGHEDFQASPPVKSAEPTKPFPITAAIGGTVPSSAAPTSTNSEPTVIVHRGTHPIVLLGGVAIIAIAMIIAVMLVINNSNGETTTPTTEAVTTATGAGGVAANTTQLPAPTSGPPTATPTVAPPTATPLPRFGQVSYATLNNPGDSVNVRVENLSPTGPGQLYAVWLSNTADNTLLYIGNVLLDAQGAGALSFTDPEERLLPAFFNQVQLSVESSGFAGDTPTGEIRYSGSVPVDIPVFLSEIFVASEDGISGGSLVDGARAEAGAAGTHAGLASGSSNIGGVRSHTEHTINILKGETVDYNDSGRGDNPGRGEGVYKFLDLIEDQLHEAVNMSGATIALQTNADALTVCLDNTRRRADRLVELGLEQLAAEDIEAIAEQLAESAQVGEELMTGSDANDDGIIDAFEDECGLNQLEAFGILVGSMEIFKQ